MRGSPGRMAVLLACALCACGGGEPDAQTGEYATRAQAEFLEAEREANTPPPPLTRQEARAEYARCLRRLSIRDTVAHPELRGMRADPPRACAHWLAKAAPEPRHVLRRDPDSLYIAPAPMMTREELDKRSLESLWKSDPPSPDAPRRN